MLSASHDICVLNMFEQLLLRKKGAVSLMSLLSHITNLHTVWVLYHSSNQFTVPLKVLKYESHL